MEHKIKRYYCTDEGSTYESYGAPIMKEDPSGDYVKFSDVEPLIKALEFYATESNWRSDGGLDFHAHVKEKITNDSWYPNDDEHHPYCEVRGGKKARQALKKLEGE